jgi:protein SCO1
MSGNNNTHDATIQRAEQLLGSEHACARPFQGPMVGYIPNIIVQLHDTRRAMFYEDLLLGKAVLIACIAGRNGDGCGVLSTFAELQSLLGDRLGKDVFLYCLTTDPEHDTPSVLQQIAERYGARNGWLMLTGQVDQLKLLRQRLFTHSGGHDCSMTLIRYGNESVGLWGGLSASSSAHAMAERLSWIQSHAVVVGAPRRKGPPPLDP